MSDVKGARNANEQAAKGLAYARLAAAQRENQIPKASGSWTPVHKLIGFGISVVALVVVIGMIMLSLNKVDAGKVTAFAGGATATVQATSSDCPNGYPLNYVKRSGIGDVVQRPGDEGQQYKFEDKEGMLKASAEDPIALAAYLHEFLPVDYPNGQEYTSLIDESGKCLSINGAQALDKLKLMVNNSSVKVGEASASDVNTGSGNEGIVSNTAAGISGDRKALIFDIPGSDKQVSIMLRCGNPTHKTAAYPQVPLQPQPPVTRPPTTVNPPPTTIVPPPVVCPDGSPLPCLPPPVPCEETGECKNGIHVDLPTAPPAPVSTPAAPPNIPSVPYQGEREGSANNEDRHSPGGVSAIPDQQQPVHDAEPDVNMSATPEPQAPAPSEAPTSNVDPDAAG